jgi:preprotein translocase subunit SecG
LQAVLIIVHLLVAVALTFVVLMQRSEGGALGMGGGGSGLGGLFSQRGAANTLTRTTVILGVMFFATSMTLTLLALGNRQTTSIITTVPGQAAPANPKGPPTFPAKAPAPPTFPAAPAGPPASPPVNPLPPGVPPTR